MSFLVSFNGQFTPHVYQVNTPSTPKLSPLQGVKGIKSEARPSEFEEVLNETKPHPPARGFTAYQKQQTLFEEKK